MTELPSAGRVAIELQKAVTRAHRRLLESPAGPFVSRFGLQRFLVLVTTGHKTAQPRETPLSYTRDADAYVVIASNGGAPRDPNWFRNLQATPQAAVVVDGQRHRVRAEVVEGPERQRLWRAATRSYPLYAAYQARTEREIPVVRLVPMDEPTDRPGT